MLHDRFYWFIILIFSIPLSIFLVVHLSEINILLTEPMLSVASVIIKTFNLSDEGVVFIVKHSQNWFYIYSAFLLLLSSIFAIIGHRDNNEENRRPWKYPFIVFIEILIIVLVLRGISYYRKVSYQKAVRQTNLSNNLINNIKATNVADLAYDRNILKIEFDTFHISPQFNKLIIEMVIRDKQGKQIGFTAIKATKVNNKWHYKDMLFDKPLKLVNGKIQTQTVLYNDKSTLARIISVIVEDANPVSPMFNKAIVAKDVVIKYEKNPFLKK